MAGADLELGWPFRLADWLFIEEPCGLVGAWRFIEEPGLWLPEGAALCCIWLPEGVVLECCSWLLPEEAGLPETGLDCILLPEEAPGLK